MESSVVVPDSSEDESSIPETSEESSIPESSEESSIPESSEDEPALPPVSQGDDRTEMPVYEGDATDLGFPADTDVVYTVVGAPWAEGDNTTWNNRIVIQTEADKDYLKFDVVFSADDASLTIWPGPNGAYSFSASGLTPSDDKADPTRKVVIVDINGCQPTSLVANTLYTVYFYLNEDDPSVQFNAFKDMTTYVANIEFGNGDVNPIIPNIYSQDKAAALPVYTGDVTELGFEEGTTVMVNTAAGSTWNDAAYFDTDETTNCLTVRFAYSSVPNGQQFMIHNGSGFCARINDGLVWHDEGDTEYCEVELLDADGNRPTTLEENTVYTLKIYHNGATSIKICPIGNEYFIYYDNDFVENNDEYVAPHEHNFVDGECECGEKDPNYVPPEPEGPIVSGETTSTALNVYDGDVTALGFAEGTTVYQLVSADAWNDRVKIATDSTYKYLDIEFMVSEGPWYFLVWVCDANGMLDGNYLINENTGNGTYGNGYAPHFPNAGTSGGATRMQVLDASGNVATGVRTNGTVYTLRVWIQDENLANIQIGQTSTIYFGNIECTDSEPEKAAQPIQQGGVAMPTYTGDVTALGFEEGTMVQYMVTETIDGPWGTEPVSGKSREQLAANIFGEAGKYVTVKFATSEDVSGTYVFYVWGLYAGSHTQNDYVDFARTTYGRIMDEKGHVVTSLSKNTVYVLELYIEGTDTYRVANMFTTGMELYFATETVTCSDKSMLEATVVQGDSRVAMPTYDGDVTSLGFAADTTVYVLENTLEGGWTDDAWANRAIVCVPGTQDYVVMEFVSEKDITGNFVYLWGVAGAPAIGYVALSTTDIGLITDMDGNAVTSIVAGQHYLLYVACAGLSEIQVGLPGGINTVHFANVSYENGAFAAN